MTPMIDRAHAAHAAAELQHWCDGTHAERPTRANVKAALRHVLPDRKDAYRQLAQALGRAKVAEREADVLRGAMRADEDRVRGLIAERDALAREVTAHVDELSVAADQLQRLMDTVDELSADLEAARTATPTPTRSQAMLLQLLDEIRPDGEVTITTETSRCVVPHGDGA